MAIVQLTAADGSNVPFDGPPPTIDDRVEVIIHQDTRTASAVRVFVFRGRTRDLERPDRAFVRKFVETEFLHAQVVTPPSVDPGIASDLGHVATEGLTLDDAERRYREMVEVDRGGGVRPSTG